MYYLANYLIAIRHIKKVKRLSLIYFFKKSGSVVIILGNLVCHLKIGYN